jgi:aspartyl aminopeptidase
MDKLINFLDTSYTAYHAHENAKAILLGAGFTPLNARDDWEIAEGGKYFVERGGCSLIAFTLGGLDNFSYKICAAHLDSVALKIKENPIEKTVGGLTLNTEPYGGGNWYSFFDRPLKIAGRVVKCENNRVYTEMVVSPFIITLPSIAVHQNRNINDGVALNLQTDLQPLIALSEENAAWLTETIENALSFDLFIVSAQTPFFSGANNEFLSAPRIDNLTSVVGILEGITSHAESDGVCVAALFNAEEIGNVTPMGANGDFLETVLRRIAYALRFDDNEYYKALASSFLLSVDNGHAVHPNHPEKSDTTNKCVMGGGVAIKYHAKGSYITDGLTAGVVKALFDKAGVKHQAFFNRADVRSGGTLGQTTVERLGVPGADIGIAQLSMHSACECFAHADYEELKNGLIAFYSSDFLTEDDGFIIR